MELFWGFYLGWDWPPVVFFIVLGIALAIAWFTKFWLTWFIPALVLYAGLDWGMPSWLMLLFKLVFWITVIVVIVMAVFRRGPTRFYRLPFFEIASLIAFLLVLMFLNVALGMTGIVDAPKVTDEPTARPAGDRDVCLLVNGEDDRAVIQKELPVNWSWVNNTRTDCVSYLQSAPSEPTTSPSPAVEACPELFVQELDPNFRNRAVTEGFEGLAGEKRQQTLAAMARDYRYLDAVGDYVFNRDYDASTLYVSYGDALCLSEAGQNLYQQVKGALMASSVVSGLAPEDGYNSGFKDRVFIIRERQGVRGDRRATIYTLSDGRELIILDNCGNLVFPESHRD